MRKTILKSLYFCTVIISAFVGAGFASGAEIVTFFNTFNFFSIHFAFFISVIFGFFINKNLQLQTSFNNSKYLSFAETLIFFILTSTMISGISEISHNIYPNFPLITILSLTAAFLLLRHKFENWTKISSIICIIILFGIVCNCILNSPYKINMITHTPTLKTFINPLLYLTMNCFTIYPLIQSLGKITSDKKQRLLISIFCSAILFILIVIILLVLSNSSNSSMPMLDLAQNISPSFYIFYLITLLLSIFTTLLSCFYSLSEKTALIIKNKTMNSLLCFTSCLAFSFIGFNKIITYFYPLVGIIGLVFLIYQIIISNKYRKQKLKSSEITLKINKSVKL